MYFIEVSGKAVCLVCNESIAVLKRLQLVPALPDEAEKYRNMSSEQRTGASKEFSQNCIQQTTELLELATYCPTKLLNIASYSLRANALKNV
jgi:hypothetical protein